MRQKIYHLEVEEDLVEEYWMAVHSPVEAHQIAFYINQHSSILLKRSQKVFKIHKRSSKFAKQTTKFANISQHSQKVITLRRNSQKIINHCNKSSEFANGHQHSFKTTNICQASENKQFIH